MRTKIFIAKRNLLYLVVQPCTISKLKMSKFSRHGLKAIKIK